MPSVHNPTAEERVVPGYPAFAPGEVREVSVEDAVYLTNGSGLVRVEAAPVDPPPESAPKKRKPSLPDNA